MNDPAAGKGDETEQRDAGSLDALILRAQLLSAWERAWPLLAVPLGVAGLFVATSWFDAFGVLSGLPRLALSLAFLIAFLASLWPLRKLRRTSREEALLRIDRSIGLPHRPATSRQDRLAQGSGDPLAEILWRRHLRAAREASRNVRLGIPSPGLPARDRYGLRVGVILVLFVAFFYAGPDRLDRLAGAFRSPGFDIDVLLFGKPAEDPGTRLDAWVTPPPYTRRPPVVLTSADDGAATSVPQHSLLVVRLAGDDGARIVASGGAEPVGKQADEQTTPAPGVIEQRFNLLGDTSVAIQRSNGAVTTFAFTIIPDRPPVIAFDGPVTADGRGGMTLAYTVDDDYGATNVEARTALEPGGHPLYEAPRIALQPPAGRARSGKVSVMRDLSANPLAGASVKMTLVARDDGGNEGRSEPQDVTLAQRNFTNPLAKALIEQRLRLALDANQSGEVKYALQALMIAPEDFTKDYGVYLGLRTAWRQLDRANSDDAFRGVVDYLWQIANAIEDGDGTLAERQLKAARQNLRDALQRGASPEEIERLTKELRQALNNFMQDYAKRQAQSLKHGQSAQNREVRRITPDDLKKLLDEIEKSAKNGDKDNADKLMSELDNILNNLQNPEDSTAQQDPSMQQMQQSLNDMGKMILRQQRLRDQTYRQNQPPSPDGQGGQDQDQDQGQNPGEEGQQGLPGGERQGQGEGPGQQGEGQQGQGQPSPDDLRNQQEALRKQLERMQKQLRESGAETPDALGDAGSAMSDAERQLGENDGDGAVGSQGKAIEALRRAAKSLSDQMAQARKDGKGTGEQQGNRSKDPLGRPMQSYDGEGPKIPKDSPAERAGRVIEELRRRLADPNRPKAETDYLERLLKQE